MSLDQGMEADVQSLRPEEFEPQFKGSAAEYFRIWIVNLFLTIITFGVYSAWAKVRTQRYFLGNTELAGSNFEYTGDPLKILKGRLLIGSLIGLYYLAVKFVPEFAYAAAFLITLGSPWIIVNALAFRLRNTVYRGLRFGFERNYRDANTIYLLHGILFSVLSLGFYYPAALAKWYRFLGRNSRYGQASFKSDLQVLTVYEIVAKTLIGVVLGAVVIMICGILIVAPFHSLSNSSEVLGVMGKLLAILGAAGFFAAVMLFYLCVLTIPVAIGIQIKRAFWNSLSLEKVFFVSVVNTAELLWIWVTNALAIIFSLGMLYPWARVRKYKYELSHLRVMAAADNMKSFAQTPNQDVRPLGEASADLLDIGLEI